MRIASGVTDQYVYFIAVDATDLSTRETGLSSFTVVRSRNGAADVTFTTPTVSEIDATTMPGVYALLLDEDMTIGAGNDEEEMAFHITHAGMAPVTRAITLYRPKITSGETLAVASGVADADVVLLNGVAEAAVSLSEYFNVMEVGTAQSATATTIVLAASGPVNTDEYYNNSFVLIVSATTGAGQIRVIDDYVQSTRTCTVKDWTITPTGTIKYHIIPGPPASETTLVPVNVTQFGGTAGSFSGGLPAVNVTQVSGTAQDIATATGVAGVSSKVDTVDTVVDAILVDTDTTIPALLAALDTLIDAIKAKTDSLTFTTGAVQADVQKINTVDVVGDGSGTPFTV